jgi:hypothetical protein
VTLLPDPSIALEPHPEHAGESIARCVCGTSCWGRTDRAAEWAEVHALQCSRFREWARERVDNLGYTLGYYIPAQVTDLLHQLLGEPRAAAVVMPWLIGIENRPEFDG